MARRGEQTRGRRGFHDAAEIDDGDAVRDARHQAQIVADEEIGEVALALQPPSSSITCAWIDTSSAEVGSSSTSMRGPRTSARASETRWRCPPESSCGRRAQRPVAEPDRLERRAHRLAPRARMADAVDDAAAPPPGLRRKAGGRAPRPGPAARSASRGGRLGAAPMSASSSSRPSKRMLPALAPIRPATARAMVDLPEPLSPTTASVSPGAIVKETPSTARNGAARRRNSPRRPVKWRDEVLDHEQRRPVSGGVCSAAPVPERGRAASSSRV